MALNGVKIPLGLGQVVGAQRVTVDVMPVASAASAITRMGESELERVVANRPSQGLLLSVPKQLTALAGSLRKWAPFFKTPPLVDLMPGSTIRDLFSSEAQTQINERLNQYSSQKDREDLEILYRNLKLHILFPEKWGTNRLAIEKLLHKFDLHLVHTENGIEILPYHGGVSLSGPAQTPLSLQEAIRSQDPDTWSVRNTYQVVVGVRALLKQGQYELASDLLLAPREDEETTRAHYAILWETVFPLLTREERAHIFAVARSENDVVEFIRVVEALAGDHLVMSQEQGFRLAEALHLLGEFEAEAVHLSSVLKILFSDEETESVGRWLVTSAALYGDYDLYKVYQEAYDSIPEKPASWYSFDQIILNDKLRENVRQAVIPSYGSKAQEIAYHVAILETDPVKPFVLNTKQVGVIGHGIETPVDLHAEDHRRLMLALSRLEKLAGRGSLEQREKIAMGVVEFLQQFENPELAGQFMIKAQAVLVLKRLKERLWGDVADQVELAILNYGEAGAVANIVMGLVPRNTLIDMVNARDHRSRDAFMELVRRSKRNLKRPAHVTEPIYARFFDSDESSYQEKARRVSQDQDFRQLNIDGLDLRFTSRYPHYFDGLVFNKSQAQYLREQGAALNVYFVSTENSI